MSFCAIRRYVSDMTSTNSDERVYTYGRERGTHTYIHMYMHEQRNLFIQIYSRERGGRGFTHPSGDMSDRDRGFLRPSTNYNRSRYARRTLAHGRVIKPFLYYTARERSLPRPPPHPSSLHLFVASPFRAIRIIGRGT